MRISIDWLKEFVDAPSSTEQTADMLTMLGLEAEQGLDAATYFLGHGLKNVRCLQGGIDTWSLEVDDSVPRYEFS